MSSHRRSPSADSSTEEFSVLMHAATLGRTDIVQNAIGALRSNGASEKELNELISTGRPEDDATPLHLAAAGGHADVIRYLLVRCSPPPFFPSHCPLTRNSPLVHTCHVCSQNANADLTVKPTRGDVFLNKRPYDVATDAAKQAFHVYMFEQIAMGRVETIARLLRGGVPVTIRDGFQLDESALHWAASFNNTDVAQLLLLHGADASVANLQGETPLHSACKALNVGLAGMLLLEGASPAAADSHGKAPQDWMPKPHPELEQLLANPPAVTAPLRAAYLQRLEEEAAAAAAAAAGAEGDDEDGDGDDEDDGDDERFLDRDADADAAKSPLLVLWPPAQRQVRSGLEPFVMHSAESLLICVASESVDVFPLLSWSGLVDALDRFNLVAQVCVPCVRPHLNPLRSRC
jgi:hypothetical protein